MIDFVPKVGKPVVAHLGLKKRNWRKKADTQTIASDCLRARGINAKVNCFLKDGHNFPAIVEGSDNIIVKLRGRNSIVIVA